MYQNHTLYTETDKNRRTGETGNPRIPGLGYCSAQARLLTAGIRPRPARAGVRQAGYMVLVSCFAVFGAVPAGAADIAFDFGVSALDSNVIAIDYIGLEEVETEENYHFRGTLRVDQGLTEHLGLTVLALQDPMLERRVLGRLNIIYDWFRVEAGPFIGIVNTASALITPGLSLYLGVTAPQSVFGSLRYDTTLLSSIDGYTANQADITLGVNLPFLPEIVPSASLSMIYTERRDAGFITSRKQNRYSINIDTAGPYNSYAIQLAFGYQELGWNVYHASQSVIYQLNSVYGKLTITYQLMPGLKMRIGGLIPILTWITKENVDGIVPNNPLFYDFTIGVIWSWNLRRQR